MDKGIILEVTKPDRGAFIKFDSEGQSEMRFVLDSTQKEQVKQVESLPYGETFFIVVAKKVTGR